MDRQNVEYTAYYAEVMRTMAGRGLLLGSYDANRKPNVMTIGWGQIGYIWGKPIWTVLVRPSRYTYRCIEHTGCFTVNVPGEDLSLAVAECGSTSGRDVNKFAASGLTEEQGVNVFAPVVGQCPIVYECQVVHRNDVIPDRLADEILSGMYVDGDYHRVYFGHILATRASADAARQL
ncbi:MAG: flavin reductase family protein [Phycisphaerae bacterium]|nr:flavin reductase family protein [Phycisphaerae bacterium]